MNGRVVLRALLPGAGALAVAAAALWFWHGYYEAAFRGLIYNDALDYASLARNFARGKGLVSQYLTPLGLVHHGVPQPDLWRAPLWPLLLAGFQRLFGFIDEASALAGGFCFAAGAGLVFLLGRRWFNLPVALAAAVLYVFSGQLLLFSTSGLTEPLALLMMLAWAAVLTGAPERSWRGFLAAGGMTGLFYLVRYNAVLFLLPGLLFLIWRARRSRADGGRSAGREFNQALRISALFLFGFFLAAGPWLGRNLLLTGNPFFSLQKYEPAMFTRTYPGYSLYMRPERVDVAAFLQAHPEEVGAKVAAGWQAFRRDLFSPGFTGVALPVFLAFLLALTLPLDGEFPAQRGVRPLLVSCFLIQLAALLPLHYIPRLFIIFTPFYMIYAAGGLWWLVCRAAACAAGCLAACPEWGRASRPPGAREARPPARLILGILALGAFAFFGARAGCPDFHFDLGGPHPRVLRAEALRDAAALVPPDRVVLSNEGHLFAWYGDRFACKIPYTPALLPEVARLAPVGALYLSNWITWNLPEADPLWIKFYLTRPPAYAGFTLVKVYPDGSLLYLRR